MPIPRFLAANVRALRTIPSQLNDRNSGVNKDNFRFPLADVLWTLAMALDVLLIVFYRHDARTLRKLEIKYISIITTVVFIPALTFLFIHTPEKGHMYGSQKVGGRTHW